ncbi:MAG TPA: serine/threonine protein kinase [Variovorax sp.]|nr:serine/threonine protein kinase [Variovorax sp.]
MRFDSRKSLLLALVMAFGGGTALAQKPDKPADTGQTPNSREAVRAEAYEAARNTSTTPVPSGEASTMSNSQPNMQTVVPERSRAQARLQVTPSRPRFGESGERPDVPTNPTDGEVGTPK